MPPGETASQRLRKSKKQTGPDSCLHAAPAGGRGAGRLKLDGPGRSAPPARDAAGDAGGLSGSRDNETTMPKPVLLWTDAAVWLLFASGVGYTVMVLRSAGLRRSWRRVFADAPALASSVVLSLCLAVTLLDSIHWRAALPTVAGAAAGAPVAYDVRTRSLLDLLLDRVEASREKSYSRPLAAEGFLKESTTLADGRVVRVAPRLVHGGAHLRDPDAGVPPTSLGALWRARRRRWPRSPQPRRCSPGCSRVAVAMAAHGAPRWRRSPAAKRRCRGAPRWAC